MPSLESYEATINAYASIIIPRDDGSIQVTAVTPIGTITVQGVILTAAAGARVVGALPTFDNSGSTSAIATSIQDAINDPANPFQALGVSAKAFSGVVGLRRTDPSVAIVNACTNITVLQAVIGDFAAGSLSRQVTPLHVETFAMQVIRWIRFSANASLYWNYSSTIPVVGTDTPAEADGLIDVGFSLNVNEVDGLILFDEMDAQAEFYLGGGSTFDDLPVGPTFPFTAGTQQAVVDSLFAGTLVIQGDSGLSSTQMRTLARVPVVMSALKAAYWLNYPNHQVWGKTNMGIGNSGTGTGEPVFYDVPADETSNPNDRSVVTAFTYRKWPMPMRQGLEDRWRTAQLEVNVAPVASNAEFIALTAEWNAKTLIDVG